MTNSTDVEKMLIESIQTHTEKSIIPIEGVERRTVRSCWIGSDGIIVKMGDGTFKITVEKVAWPTWHKMP